MTQAEWLEELIAQIEVHGPNNVYCELETDSGSGRISISDVTYEDDVIKVTFV